MDGQCETKTRPAKTKDKATAANPPRILLAEDDFEMRKLLAWSLGRNGYTVVECQDGYSLMKKLGLLSSTQRDNHFDLIISDIRMPAISGLQVMESLKQFENFPPMILITAFPNREVRDRAQRLGAAAILAKPFDFDELLVKVHQILPKLSLEKQQRPPSDKKQINLRFPLYINFHNCSEEQSIKDFIRETAIRLNRFADHIMLCRIVINESESQENRARRYHVSIILTLSGKTIVALHNSNKSASRENLCIAIGIAFDKVCRQLKNYLRDHNQHKGLVENY